MCACLLFIFSLCWIIILRRSFLPIRGFAKRIPSDHIYLLCVKKCFLLWRQDLLSLLPFMRFRLPELLILFLTCCLHMTILFFLVQLFRKKNVLKSFLDSFERTLGQVINIDKSMLCCSQNVSCFRFNELTKLLEVKTVERYNNILLFLLLLLNPRPKL